MSKLGLLLAMVGTVLVVVYVGLKPYDCGTSRLVCVPPEAVVFVPTLLVTSVVPWPMQVPVGLVVGIVNAFFIPGTLYWLGSQIAAAGRLERKERFT